jgi:hypothetical protein
MKIGLFGLPIKIGLFELANEDWTFPEYLPTGETKESS